LRDLAAQGENRRDELEKVVLEVLAIIADLRSNDNNGESTSARRRRLRTESRTFPVLYSTWRVLKLGKSLAEAP